MSSKKLEEIWRWPKYGQTEVDPQDSISPITESEITDLYRSLKPPVCYPGTNLDYDKKAIRFILEVLRANPNLIGTHTHFDTVNGVRTPKKGEGGFSREQQIEAIVIWMIAGMVGGTPETTDGLFCSGGTEANLQGMWIGRNWLRQNCPDPNHQGIVILATPLVHYSAIKNAEMLDIGDGKFETCKDCGNLHQFKTDISGTGITFVQMNDMFEMDIEDLRRVFKRKYRQGFRRFMIIPTVGTTDTGSIDPIAEISDFIEEVENTTICKVYMHVDASFGGFTVPFVNPDLPIGFENKHVMSMTLDADKMGRLPYPAGVFLCRKDLSDYIAREVCYVKGNHDDSVSGSRTALPAVLADYTFRKIGTEGQREHVQACLDARDALAIRLEQELGDYVKVMPFSPWINLLPIQILKDQSVLKALFEDDGPLASYQMRSDFISTKQGQCPEVLYKLCIMPHLLVPGVLDTFVETLKQALCT